MSNLSIVKKYFSQVDEKGGKLPRSRFTQFYEDLYARFELGQVDPETYCRGAQLSYAELGDLVLKQCEADGILKSLELLVICYWAPEFDPDYSAGAYFCERYRIRGKTFDICDQGVLSPITAIKLIKSYFNHTEIKNALLVCLDQTTIPRSKSDMEIEPKKSTAMAIFFKKKFNSGSANIIHAKLSCKKESLFFSSKLSDAKEYSIGFSEDFRFINCSETLRPILDDAYPSSLGNPYFMIKVLDGWTQNYGFIFGRLSE